MKEIATELAAPTETVGAGEATDEFEKQPPFATPIYARSRELDLGDLPCAL